MEGIDADAVRDAVNGIRREIDYLLDQQKKENNITAYRIDDIVDIVETIRDMPALYAKLDADGKAEIIRNVCRRITVYDDHVAVEWAPHYAALLNNPALEIVRKSIPMHANVDNFRTAARSVLLQFAA